MASQEAMDSEGGTGYHDKQTPNDMTREGQDILEEGGAGNSNTFCVQDDPGSNSSDLVDQEFSGFSEEEISASSKKGELFGELISSFDEQIDITKQDKTVSGEKQKGDKKTKPASFGSGSSKRVKIYLFEDFPIENLSRKKLQRVNAVMLNFYHHLFLDDTRAHHSNKFTLATQKAIREAAKKTCTEIKLVWSHHLTNRLVVEEKKIIIDDHRIVERKRRGLQLPFITLHVVNF